MNKNLVTVYKDTLPRKIAIVIATILLVLCVLPFLFILGLYYIGRELIRFLKYAANEIIKEGNRKKKNG